MTEEEYQKAIDSIKSVKTCDACPEQYAFYCKGKKVGYLRVRYGVAKVFYPDETGTCIQEWKFKDEWKGCFDDETRDYFLQETKKAILSKLIFYESD